MFIVKVGGGRAINFEGVAKDIAQVSEKCVLVHGANAFRDELAEELGKPKKVVTSLSGYSSVFSDEDAIDIMMMAYAGLRNKRMVELLQLQGINAVGLSGLDGRMVQGKRNRGIKVQEGDKKMLLKDFSGKPQSINTELLTLLLEHGYTPVLCVPIIDENGYAINSENDDIITLLQSQMKAETVIQLIEAPGFLEDPADPSTVVPEIPSSELAEREEQVSGRMKRKMLALRRLFEHGAGKVLISDGRTESPILDALGGKGTVIQ